MQTNIYPSRFKRRSLLYTTKSQVQDKTLSSPQLRPIPEAGSQPCGAMKPSAYISVCVRVCQRYQIQDPPNAGFSSRAAGNRADESRIGIGMRNMVFSEAAHRVKICVARSGRYRQKIHVDVTIEGLFFVHALPERVCSPACCGFIEWEV